LVFPKPGLNPPAWPWPQPLARLDSESRALATALSISIVLHAVVLSIHFKLPDALRRLTPSQLDVVLVNSKTRSRPAQPEIHAQANLDGGGDTDLDRRATSPLPSLQLAERGTELKQATRRVEDLETRQRQLLSQTQPRQEVAAAGLQAETKSRISGVELAESALLIARMEAQIARQIEEYNKRPRKTFVGARAAEVRYALYVEDWRQKIERIGNLNYPESARGRIYGSLRLTVSINSDGTVAGVDLEQSSGYKILDAAAQRIVELAAPYARFPPDIRKETDILVITRTWRFARGDKVFSE
jgi:periplasmic protein TonB